MKFKILNDIKTKEGHSFKKNEIVNGKFSATKGFVDVTPNGTLILTAQKTSKLAFPMQLSYVYPKPPVNPLPDDNIILVDPPVYTNPNERKIKMLFSTIGTIGGIYYAYKKKKSASGYLGFAILGLIAGNVVAMVVNKVKRK
jgi:hypothetical protein